MSRAGKILIIDDDIKWLAFVKDVLREYVVEEAPDTQAGLKKLVEDGYDLVITDAVHMDDVPDIARQRCGRRVLIVTVSPSTHEAIKAYDVGAMAYVKKAREKSTLQQAVDGAIQKPPPRRLAWQPCS